MTELQTLLFSLQDLTYKQFMMPLLPNVDPDSIIGIRTPVLRTIAKEYKEEAFLQQLPHTFFEENQIHAFRINRIKDFDIMMEYLEAFLPFVDNWATCDQMNPLCMKKHLPELLPSIQKWMVSRHEYTVRFGIGVLMRYYLDEAFEPAYLAWVGQLRRDEYYIRMMQAWYFATAMAKQPEDTIPWIEQKKLDPWVHNKSIQKAVESRRIDARTKDYLRTLRSKRKGNYGT